MGGQVFCWQPADGALEQPIHKRTAVDGLSGVIDLDVGIGARCAVMIDGRVACWGRNHHGELGHGGREAHSPSPVIVRGVGRAQRVSVGQDHACALSDGRALCWGRNEQGQTGADVAVLPAARELSAVHRIELDDVVQVSAGGSHSCALTKVGDVFCWGRLLERLPSIAPTHIEALGKVKRIASISDYVCAVTRDGGVRCVGNNLAGRLGADGRGMHELPIEDAVDIAVAGLHACALQSGGRLSCWGSDAWGQLGRGGIADGRPTSAAPAIVADLPPIRAVSLGGAASCAITGDDELLCWGKHLSSTPKRISYP